MDISKMKEFMLALMEARYYNQILEGKTNNGTARVKCEKELFQLKITDDREIRYMYIPIGTTCYHLERLEFHDYHLRT